MTHKEIIKVIRKMRRDYKRAQFWIKIFPEREQEIKEKRKVDCGFCHYLFKEQFKATFFSRQDVISFMSNKFHHKAMDIKIGDPEYPRYSGYWFDSGNVDIRIKYLDRLFEEINKKKQFLFLRKFSIFTFIFAINYKVHES